MDLVEGEGLRADLHLVVAPEHEVALLAPPAGATSSSSAVCGVKDSSGHAFFTDGGSWSAEEAALLFRSLAERWPSGAAERAEKHSRTLTLRAAMPRCKGWAAGAPRSRGGMIDGAVATRAAGGAGAREKGKAGRIRGSSKDARPPARGSLEQEARGTLVAGRQEAPEQ